MGDALKNLSLINWWRSDKEATGGHLKVFVKDTVKVNQALRVCTEEKLPNYNFGYSYIQ